MDWAARQEVFESMAAIAGGAFTLQEGGAAFLPKPFTDQELLAAVGRAVMARPERLH